MQNNIISTEQNIKDKIYTIRNQQVMLDRDLAELYGVNLSGLENKLREI